MSDDADDDPQLKSLRAVWLSMPDEDPPERGLAELMAAARVKAEQMAKPSLWQRIVALLRRPPVFALATVLIIIGGVVFVGQRRDKLQHEETAGDQSPPAIAQGSAAVVETPGAAQDKSKEEAKPAEMTLDQRDEKDLPTAEPPAVPEPPPRTRPPTRRATGTDASGIRRGLAGTGGGGGGGGAAVAQEPPKVDYGTKKNGEDLRAKATSTSTVHAEGRFESEKQTISGDTFAAEPKLEKAEPTAGAAASPSDDRAPATSRPPPEKSPSSRAAQYLAQARSAAARGDCSAARVMMKRVQSEDAAAYKKAVASDAALKKCVVAAQ